jgi:hypothetical protein
MLRIGFCIFSSCTIVWSNRRSSGDLANDLKLGQEQRLARRSGSGELAWNNLVRYKKRRLVDAGFVDHNSPRGLWRLMLAGCAEAERRAKAKEPIDPATLEFQMQDGFTKCNIAKDRYAQATEVPNSKLSLVGPG